MHLEKPQAATTITPKAVAQAAPDSQLLNRQPHPNSLLQRTDSCVPDLGGDWVACFDQNSVQRPGSASHSGPTPLPATEQPTPQGPAEVRTSTMPDTLAETRSSIQPHQLPQTQLAQPPALNYKLSSKISVVPRQAAELDQLPNALPHPVPQKPLKVHLVSVAGDVEAQALEHRETQTQGGEQHEKQIQAQEQHEQLVHASDFVILAARNEDKVSHIEVRNKNRKDYTFNINSMRSRVLHRAAQVHSGNTSKCYQGDCTSKEADEVLGSCHADALLCWLHPVHLWLAGLICA